MDNATEPNDAQLFSGTQYYDNLDGHSEMIALFSGRQRVRATFLFQMIPRLVVIRIIPQAVSVRYGLSIGARCAPLVLCFMWIFGTFLFLSFAITVQLINACAEAPIAWPIAKLLYYVLGGNEAHTYKKAELKSFLQFHRHGEEPLRDDEISILNGVLELNNKSVEAVMTRMHVSSSLQGRGPSMTDLCTRTSSHSVLTAC
jgi:CBS domain containing-hemolysin-like protein